MNVIISNRQKQVLDKLDIEVIKRVDGEYTVDELLDIFQNLFFNKMVIDITAIKNYQDIRNIQKLSISFDMSKIILLIDANSGLTSPDYLSKLISMGIYNFTTNLEGLIYLYTNPNTYRDVAQYHRLDSMIIQEETEPKVEPITPVVPIIENQVNEQSNYTDLGFEQQNNIETTETENIDNFEYDSEPNVEKKKRIIGVKSVTPGAGSTTLVYLMKKHLEKKYRVLALEVEKRDFIYFNDKTLLSLSNSVIGNILTTNEDKDIILVDLNGSPTAENFCTDVLYLIEPSIIKINRLLSIKPKILSELKSKKIILCPSMLNSKDVKDFEYESTLKVFYNLPPVDDHGKNREIDELLIKLGFSKLK